MRVLKWAITTPARYVAMIGSKRKVLGVVKELETEGIPREAFDRLHAPMGLEIGAVTPEEIAIAVAAEMIAMRRNAGSAWRNLSKSIFVNASLRTILK
jgi:xanthine dehydrogenase accessory factor